MSNTTQTPRSPNTTNILILDKDEDGEEVDIGVIIGVISLLILTVVVVIIIFYFSRLKKRRRRASTANVLRSESNQSNDELNVVDEERHLSSNPSVINMQGIEEILQKVRHGTITEEEAKNDPILFDFLKQIENGSLTGSPDLLEMCKCDGISITKEPLRDNTENYINMNEKSKNNNESFVDDAFANNSNNSSNHGSSKHINAEPNTSYVRTICELENSETSNGEKDKSYFEGRKKHKTHNY